MDSGIGSLRVHVRTADTDPYGDMEDVRAFAAQVMDRCHALLEARQPDRCLFIRRLETRWRLSARHLRDPAERDSVARELADALEALARSEPAGVVPDANVVRFGDEADYRAEYLRAVAARMPDGAWFFAPLAREGPALGALARADQRELCELVLLSIARRGDLPIVLEALPAVASAFAALPPGARDRIAGAAAAGDQTRLAGAGRPDAADGSILPEVARPLVTDHAKALTGAETMYESWTPSNDASPAETNPTSAAAPQPARVDSTVFAPASPVVDATRYGGLFYLLSTALELGIGEVAWQACLSDRAFIARVAETLIGEESDIAPRVFGGVLDGDRLNPPDDDQLGEMADALLANYVEAVPRRGLAGWPSVELLVTGRGDARLLVAACRGLPFAVFAWPASSAEALAEGVRRFLARWPLSAPRPVAHPALADAAGSTRVAGDLRCPLSRDLLVASEADVRLRAVLTQASGTLAALFAARIGAAPAPAGEFAARHLAVDAEIVAGVDLAIRIPVDRLDFAIRRAGLDRDPGWVPWLGRSVRLIFTGLADDSVGPP